MVKLEQKPYKHNNSDPNKNCFEHSLWFNNFLNNLHFFNNLQSGSACVLAFFIGSNGPI